MNKLFKIVLLILVLLPVWLTVVAFAGTNATSTAEASWTQYVNTQLLKIESPKVQITEILNSADELPAAFLGRDAQIDVSEVRDRGTSNLQLKYFRKDGTLEAIIPIRVRAFIQREVWTLTRDLPAGSLIQVSDLQKEWRDSSRVPSKAFQDRSPVGQKIRLSMNAGTILQTTHIQASSMVRRGDRLNIVVIGHGIRISGTGIAQEAGHKGETIRILNTDSKREIFGTVTDAKSAEVKL